MRQAALMSIVVLSMTLGNSSPVAASQNIAGSYIHAYYSTGGVWVDSGYGIRVYNGSWHDVTWPGTPWNQIAIEYSYGGSSYAYSANNGSYTYSSTGEADYSSGSSNESFYQFGMSGLTITKTETWEDSEKGMLVWFKATNTGGSTISDFRMMHAIDPDQDLNAYGTYVTKNDVRDDGLFVSSAGDVSALTVGYGVCDGAKQDLGHTSDWQTDADAGFVDYGGGSGDYTMHWRHRESSIAPGDTVEFGFVFIYDSSVAGASSLYDSLGTDLCSPCGDYDGDGYIDATCGGDDCDDTNPAVNPGATEICNGYDDDCDALIDDDDPTLDSSTTTTWYADVDADSFGDPASWLNACYPPSGYTSDSTDCDDTNPVVNPGMPEVCNGFDDDCDYLIDDDDPSLDASTLSTWYADEDLDGWGSDINFVDLCFPPSGYLSMNGDCNDYDYFINPDAAEVCDGVDNDCDGVIDEPPAIGATDYYLDLDGDGYGDATMVVQECNPPSGYVANADDCDDSDYDVNPGALEVCDGKDNDCDGIIDEPDAIDATTWHADVDGDTYGDPAVTEVACDPPVGFVADGTDCDDNDATIYPGAPEVPYDGIDQDCDGYDLTDVDGDGYDGFLGGGDDCHDFDADVYPGAPEDADGVDDDCDGVVDEGTEWYDDDGDGFTEDGGDCDDAEPLVNPSMREQCDGVDEDCDGIIDEETECYDDDGDGYSEDDGDCNDADPAVNPGAKEVPNNGIDDDCDGIVDYGFTDKDGDGYAGVAGDCDDLDGTVYPGAPELEDGIDNDCDGEVDEGTDAFDDDGDGYSENDGDCDDNHETTYPGADEILGNGVDDDCDGDVDEGTDAFDDDGDGFTEQGGDCDDADPTINPAAVEVMNGIDDDCDGLADEELSDLDKDGFTAEDGDCDDTNGWVYPGAIEMCDAVDNDCNDQVDEGCVEAETDFGESGCNCQSANLKHSYWWSFGLIALILVVRRKERVGES